MARFYADEDFDFGTVVELMQLGHDVLTVAQAGRRGLNDAIVLSDATAQNRIVLTFNGWHFERLHRSSTVHCGIVSCTDDDAKLLADRIHAAVAAIVDMTGQHIRVNRPP